MTHMRRTPPMRLALALAALVVASPAKADVLRCMAMAHVRTVDRTGSTIMRDSESIGPVHRVENDAKGLWLCGERNLCWPSADFDFVTPCTVSAMHGRIVEVK